jgi:KDO2-lipid IV(A) lauroyltransferase
MVKILSIFLKSTVPRIPFGVLRITGEILGLMGYAVDRRHRLIVAHNLSFIFPDYSNETITALSRKIFINTAITLLEIIQLLFSTKAHLNQKVIVLDPEHNIDQMKHHKRLILVSAHLGNWEVAPLFSAMHLNRPLFLVARNLDSAMVNRWVFNLRTRYGSTVIDKKGALQKAARALREGHAIGMLIDQDVRPKEAIKVNFLGKAVNSAPSVAWLAARYDCLVMPVFCLRKPNGKLVMEIKAPLQLKKSGNPKADIYTNTQIINDAVADAVREHVDQWFWFHKRWKRYYPELYPEEIKRIEKEKARKKKKALAEKKANSMK